MKIRHSARAYRDLVEIRRFGLINFGRVAADKYSTKLKRAVARIGQYPEIARQRHELDHNVRILPVGAHLVIYEIENGVVLILRFLHSSQNIVDHL